MHRAIGTQCNCGTLCNSVMRHLIQKIRSYLYKFVSLQAAKQSAIKFLARFSGYNNIIMIEYLPNMLILGSKHISRSNFITFTFSFLWLVLSL